MWDENQNASLFLNKDVRENRTILSPTGNLRGCIAATLGRCIPGGAAAPLAGRRSRWSLGFIERVSRKKLTCVSFFELIFVPGGEWELDG
ncbi:MAG: hypothetical protein Q4C95_05210 [Planctomycetia bacterium]|nr:hypothetical protein [Planctomycetia bacterium]